MRRSSVPLIDIEADYLPFISHMWTQVIGWEPSEALGYKTWPLVHCKYWMWALNSAAWSNVVHEQKTISWVQ